MGQSEHRGFGLTTDQHQEPSPNASDSGTEDQSATLRTLTSAMEKMATSIAEIKTLLSSDQHYKETTYEEYDRPGPSAFGPDKSRVPRETRFPTYETNYGLRPRLHPGASDPKIQLDKYTGTNTKTLPANWMRNYERMAYLEEWSEVYKANMLPFYLADEASTWYDNHISQERMAWTEVSSRFVSFFNQDKIVTPKMVATKEWDPKETTFYEHFKEMMRLFEFSETPQSWRTQLLQTSLPPYYGRICSGVEETDTESWFKRAAKIISNLPKYEGKVFGKTKDVKGVHAIHDIKALARQAPVDPHDRTEDPSKCLFCNQVNPNHKLED